MRDPRLDVLRAVAILLVLGVHWPWSSAWHVVGWTGVDLFFVLSGFLIGGLLFREHQLHGRISIARFYVRRGLKIYPAFYVLIAATVTLWIWQRIVPPRMNLVAEIFYFQNYHAGLWLHTWSLAIEEHFYLILPLLLVALASLRRESRDPFRWLPAVFAVVAIGCLALRLASYQPGPDVSYLFQTHLRMDSLFGGVLLGYLHHYRPNALRLVPLWILWIAGPALVAPVVLSNPESWFVRTWGFTLNYLGFGCLLVAAMNTSLPANRIARGILSGVAAIGVYSYSIYLWHVSVATYLPKLLQRVQGANQPSLIVRYPSGGMALFITTAIVVGILMSKVIEIPVLHLRDRWFPSRSADAAAKTAHAH